MMQDATRDIKVKLGFTSLIQSEVATLQSIPQQLTQGIDCSATGSIAVNGKDRGGYITYLDLTHAKAKQPVVFL